MSSIVQKKDFYVGTDRHRWWKEAVVYQVYKSIQLTKEALTQV
jgi:hypothetical protein